MGSGSGRNVSERGGARLPLGELLRGGSRAAGAARGGSCALAAPGRMSSSRSFGSGRPDASQSFGYIEIAVKPGSVLSSLTRTRSRAALEEEVDARHPGDPGDAEDLDGEAPDVLGRPPAGTGAGISSFAPILDVLVLVVVELAARHDLADDRGLRRRRCRAPRTRARARRSPPRRAPARRTGSASADGRGERLPGLHLRHADGRAAGRRLDEERQAESLRASSRARAEPARRPETTTAPRRRDAGVAQQRLEDRLVHADRRAGHAGADVGDAERLEKALEDAVLARRAVDDREDDVRPARSDLRRHERARGLAGRRPADRNFSGTGPDGEQPRRSRRRQETAVRPDRERNDLVLAGIERADDRARGEPRDLALDRAAAEEDDDARAGSPGHHADFLDRRRRAGAARGPPAAAASRPR